MARFGQKLGRPRTGLLLILLLSSLEGYSLAARAFLDIDSQGSQDVAVERGVGVAPDLFEDDPSEQDLQCVAVLCWLAAFARGPAQLTKAAVETGRAIGLASGVSNALGEASVDAGLVGKAFGEANVAAVADTGLVSQLIGAILNAIKIKAEACKGNLFSCVGKSALAGLFLAVVSISLFIVTHIFAVVVGAAVSLSLGSFGFFFANVFKYLCEDKLNEASAGELVRGLNASLALDNPASGVHMSAAVQSRVVGMLARVQAARKQSDGSRSLSASVARVSFVGRGMMAMFHLHTLEDVHCWCDSVHAWFNPHSLAAPNPEHDGGEWSEALRAKRHPGAIRYGWVWKRSRHIRRWRRRWLVLMPQQLLSFKSECGQSPTETVLLEDVRRVYLDEEVLQRHAFAVEVAGLTGSRTILMLPDDDGRQEAWVRAIGTALPKD